jgi:uncharacterized membrane protein
VLRSARAACDGIPARRDEFMDGFIFLAFSVATFLGLIVPILAISAFATARRQAGAVDRIGRDAQAALAAVESLRDEFHKNRGPEIPAPGPAPAPAPAPAATPAPAPAPEPAPEPARRPVWTSADPATPSPRSGLDRFERQVTSRWFVWLGAATLALAGVFLVREAIERGWLGPEVRVALGFAAGVCLVAAAEWIRRRFPPEPGRDRADYIPPALSSAGFICCYASVYAAGQLYGFLTPPFSFAAMAGVSVAAAAMAILHGPFLALLSVVGGFLTPALVTTDQPNGWALFGYLLALVAGALVMARLRGWLWMAWLALAGSTIWSVVWIEPMGAPETAPLGVFIAAVAAAYIFTAAKLGEAFPSSGPSRRWRWDDPARLALCAGIVTATLCFILARADGYEAPSLLTLAAIGAVLVYGARRYAPLDLLAPAAAVATIATLALWHLPRIIGPVFPIIWESNFLGVEWSPHLPPEAANFLTVVGAFGAAYGAAGFAALWGARRPILWAGVSTATPLALLIAAYWRIARFEIDLWWASSALALGLAALAMAGRLARYRDAPGHAGALAIYAAAVTAAITLALTMTLRDAWLSVALSLELPALAWIHRRLPVPVLRVLAGLVAAVLCARLAFNPDLLGYARAAAGGGHWVIYGYGAPLAAVYLAWRIFAGARPDWLDALLRALAFGFAALLVAFEYRALLMLIEGWERNALLDRVCYPLGWLAMAAGLTAALDRHNEKLVAARRALFAAAAAFLVAAELLIFNPVWNADPVGELPVINGLLLLYGAPAALLLAFARAMRPVEARAVPFAAASLALVFGFAWLSLETRHAFHGGTLAGGEVSEAESYAYSVVWLAYAGVLLAGGVWQRSQALRLGSLIVVMAAVAKVFVVDMADLTGLWRVASFFGLGMCLVGIGFLYQRYVFVRGGEAEAATPPSPA